MRDNCYNDCGRYREKSTACNDDYMVLAMAYVPVQVWNQVYDIDKGFEIGTIFPELNKPYVGRRCMS